ncbi:hypothetical protein K501DRAFT_284177 [Backusella circina FSU 941]|nr:hypothetical protein K501DRAFT_284177 [Backusella circina FSU 941]
MNDLQEREFYSDSVQNSNSLSTNSFPYINCYPPQTPPLYWSDATTTIGEPAISPMPSYSDGCFSCCSSLSNSPKTAVLNLQQVDMLPNSNAHQMVDPMLFMPAGLEIPHESETPHKYPSHLYSQASDEQLCGPISIEGNAQTLYFHDDMAYNPSFFYNNNINSVYNFQQKTKFIYPPHYYCSEPNNMNATTTSHQNTYRYASFSRTPAPPVKEEMVETHPILQTDKHEIHYSDIETKQSMIPTTSSPHTIPISDNTEPLPGYPCKYPNCNKRFSRPYNLKSHMRTHTSERPFACNHPSCGWKFARPHDLKRHQLQHTGQKPHSCKFCHRRFARSDALKRHWKVDVACAQALKQDQIASEASLSKEISKLCKKKNL